MLETLVRRSCSSFCTWPFFSSSAGARGERAAWIYRQATRLRCNCDNGGSRIDVNSGLMADFIDFTIDDQNAVLAGVSIGLEWELITPDREPSTWWFHVRVSLFAFHECNPIGGSKCKSNVSFAGVCACVCVCLGEHICVIQCNLFSLTVVRCSQVVRGLMTPVTWEKKEKQGCFFCFFSRPILTPFFHVGRQNSAGRDAGKNNGGETGWRSRKKFISRVNSGVSVGVLSPGSAWKRLQIGVGESFLCVFFFFFSFVSVD